MGRSSSSNSSGSAIAFEFHAPGRLIDGDLELILVETNPANPERGLVPQYKFKMTQVGENERIGHVHLRIGETKHLAMYAGHIGYGVDPEHRGHRYAARGCRLLMDLARRHGLKELWITCNPDNIASRKTCELAGAEFVEIVDLPKDTNMYQKDERQKCRYRLDL